MAPGRTWTVALPPDTAAPAAAVRADADTPALRSARWREMKTSRSHSPSSSSPRSFSVWLHLDHGGSSGMPVALLACPLRARPEDRGLLSATGTTAFSAFSGMMIARVRSGARAERKAREAHVSRKNAATTTGLPWLTRKF
uniref:Uncharacterized protein n=1 Tax=Micromonas pusilla TaxID=38833 RepID=A0A6U0IMZ2_MICPS